MVRRKTKQQTRTKELALYACYRFRSGLGPIKVIDKCNMLMWPDNMLQKNVKGWLRHSQPKDNCIEFFFPFNPLSPPAHKHRK